MIKYKYQISGKTVEEIWVCEACRKGKNELILTGKWKLIAGVATAESHVPSAVRPGLTLKQDPCCKKRSLTLRTNCRY